MRNFGKQFWNDYTSGTSIDSTLYFKTKPVGKVSISRERFAMSYEGQIAK